MGHPGGRSDFLTDAFQAENVADLDEDLDEDLRKLAGYASHKQIAGTKCIHDEEIDDDEEGDDGDSSMFEDLDKLPPVPVKKVCQGQESCQIRPHELATCWSWCCVSEQVCHGTAENEGLSLQLLVVSRQEDVQPEKTLKVP